jgi:hypothetical protein
MSERTIKAMTGTKKTRILLGVLLALCAALSSAAVVAAAAPSAPSWSIVASPYPTHFTPGAEAHTEGGSGGNRDLVGPAEYILATNIGGEPTSGPYTITETLPEGLEPSLLEGGALAAYGNDAGLRKLSCESLGQTVTCTGSQPIVPGEWVKVIVPVDVAPDLQGSVLSEAVVEGGDTTPATTVSPTTIDASPATFDFIDGPAGFAGTTTNADGSPAVQAGSHPYQLTIDLSFPTEAIAGTLAAGGRVKTVEANLPQGVIVNPQASPVLCTEAQLEGLFGARAGCPPASQIGTITTVTDLGGGLSPVTAPLYNMVPPPGTPASFGFEPLNALGLYTHLSGSVRSDTDYGLSSLTREILARPLNPVFGVQATLWGNPSDASHDELRGQCSATDAAVIRPCTTERLDTAFLTMPSACSENPLLTTARAESWEEPGIFHERGFQAQAVSGCNALEFQPTITARPTTNLADSPTGLEFNLHQPQDEHYEGLATAALKDAKVTLPQGVSVNPSGANGLAACTEAQIGYQPSGGEDHFSKQPQSCPAAAKIGSLEVSTPLLGQKLPGSIYIAEPYRNPFNSLLAIYLAIEDPQSGTIAKLAGRVEADPSTGQLTTTFEENPQLPLEDIDLKFFGGARAALTTPLTCGTKTTTSDLTPWSTPEGQDATPTDFFQTSVAAGGIGTCPSSEANAPNAPSFTAGTIAPEAGAYSPFVLKLARKDGTQRLTGLDTTLPKGLAAKFAGIPYCSDAQIAQAQSRSNPNQGALEKASPSCPAASEVGTVEVGAGSGPTPLYVSGHAYLAGPYKGAPLSLAIITPAVAGPFDLGAVVVRTALYIDPETAQGRAVSDPLPSILQGIPLDIRLVAVKLDRPGFTLNPTSCDPMAITGAASALTGQSAALTSPFQVGGCSALKFAPKLKISLKGGTKRHRFPALKAVLTYPKGNYANIASAQVTLPHSAFLEQGHIGTVCTRVQFAANACPKASIYGKAKAITPLFDQPLEGPVYLRSSSHELPDLVAALNGQIDVVLAGRVDTGKGGGIRNTFEAVPDAPVSKFVLEMKGGKKGLLVNSEDICRKPQRAIADFTAQNGKVSDTTPLIANSCKGKAKKKHAKKGKAKKRLKGSHG